MMIKLTETWPSAWHLYNSEHSCTHCGERPSKDDIAKMKYRSVRWLNAVVDTTWWTVKRSGKKMSEKSQLQLCFADLPSRRGDRGTNECRRCMHVIGAHLSFGEYFNDEKLLEAAQTNVPVTFDVPVVFLRLHQFLLSRHRRFGDVTVEGLGITPRLEADRADYI